MTVNHAEPQNYVPDVIGGTDAGVHILTLGDFVDKPVFLETIGIEVTPVNITPTGVVTPVVGPTKTIGEVVGVHIIIQVEVTLVVIGGTVVQRTAEDVHGLCRLCGKAGGRLVHFIELSRAGGQGEESQNRYDKLFHIHFLPLN